MQRSNHMNNKFQVGDLVIAPRLFEGTFPVEQIANKNIFPIRVRNKEEIQFSFTIDGRENEEDLQPSLYHAGTKITIEEVTPTRWPWVNVYQNGISGYVFTGDSFKTKEEALENRGSSQYLHTIQLKPGSMK